MKILIIGNPIASGGGAGEKIEAISRILRSRGHQVDSCLTRFAGHGKIRASTLEPDIDRVIAVGGDGTLNEIISGMIQGRCVPLLQFPLGNANLLARDLGLPQTISGAASLVEHGTITMADIGFMNGKPFIMVAGAGFDAHVTENLKKIRKGRVNNLSYVMPMIRAFRARSQKFTIQVDDLVPETGAMVLVSNVRNYAGLCDMTFRADIASGHLDVLVFPSDSPLSLARYFAAAVFSRITRLPDIVYRQGRAITITSPEPIPMQLDGDFTGRHSQVSICLEPARLPIIGPGPTHNHNRFKTRSPKS